MTLGRKQKKKMIFCCWSSSRFKYSTIKKGTATVSYKKRAFDGEATRLGACAQFPVNINQYSPANSNDVDLQQLINEPEMFPFNWQRGKKKVYISGIHFGS